ncbi:MAG: AAA family ATPase [Chloroflexota bacterium]
MVTEKIKRIPYGIGDYYRLREENGYYVDKTHFIPLIEEFPLYLFCIRPRRFGKTLWLTVLRDYYDINLAEEFDFLFGDTWIGQNPTAERNRYLVLFLNFALVNPNVEKVEESFEDNGAVAIASFVRQYERFFDDEARNEILNAPTTEQKIRRICTYVAENNLKFYLFIDEYDNFANTILTRNGRKAYEQLTHEDGFFRYFFNLIKGATGGQIRGLDRLYITGVSPITMDDVTSGFNIGKNISLERKVNELIGFTESEVWEMLTYYVNAGFISIPTETCMEVMKLWYNNYRFAYEAKTDLFNSVSVLYFLLEIKDSTRLPMYLIDDNLRIEYGKLRHLVLIDRLLNRGIPDEHPPAGKELNGNFSILKSLIEIGETISDVVLSFPLEGLLEPENFISQLYYFGLLTFAGELEGRPLLAIPNRTVRDLLYKYIRSALKDVDHFRIDPWQLANRLSAMAYRGDWEPFFDFLADEIQKQTSVRDYLEGEKVIQGFLLAYLNVTQFYHIWSEKDMGNGFADLYMEPFLARYPDMQYGYLIELEYITRGKFDNDRLMEKLKEAKKQLKQYGNDPRIQEMSAQVPIKKLILVYSGWELVHQEEV